jgi:hypothetical protein
MKKIRDVRRANAPPVPNRGALKKPGSQKSSSLYDELPPPPPGADGGIGTTSNSGIGIGITENHDLLTGAYNEAESH